MGVDSALHVARHPPLLTHGPVEAGHASLAVHRVVISLHTVGPCYIPYCYG